MQNEAQPKYINITIIYYAEPLGGVVVTDQFLAGNCRGV